MKTKNLLFNEETFIKGLSTNTDKFILLMHKPSNIL